MFDIAKGQMGRMVYRNVRGRLIVARAPVITAEPTAVQIEHRERFKLAAQFGKSVINDVDMREMYDAVAKQREMPITAVAIADFFNAPVIKRLDLDGYSGQAGGVFDIIATDDFGVASVYVKIIDDQGEIIESGHATAATDGPSRWNYNAKVTITTPVTTEVVAKDWPGGTTVKQFQFTKSN